MDLDFLKSEETIKNVSAIFYKHDYMGLRYFEAPKNEFDGEAKHLLKRLVFRWDLQGDYEDKYDNFTYEEILKELCRTIDFYENNDGGVIRLFSCQENEDQPARYTKPRLKPIDRNSNYINKFAKDLYKLISLKEKVDLDTKEVDEDYRLSLLNTIKEEIDKIGSIPSEIIDEYGINSIDDIKDRDSSFLNGFLYNLIGDPILNSL